MLKIDEKLYELVSSCCRALEECNGLWVIGYRNPNKCRNQLVQLKKSCIDVYKYVYYNLCEKGVDFNSIRSIVGYILAAYWDKPQQAVERILDYIYSIKERGK